MILLRLRPTSYANDGTFGGRFILGDLSVQVCQPGGVGNDGCVTKQFGHRQLSRTPC